MKIIFILGAITLLLILLVFGAEILLVSAHPPQAYTDPPNAPREFGGPGSTVHYLVLGDSTAAGQGAGYEDGIAVRTAEHLAKNSALSLVNLSRSGARTRDVLLEQLPLIKQAPDVVLISVGSNDVTHLTSISATTKDQKEIISKLRAANCKVKITITGAAGMDSSPRFRWPLRLVVRHRTDKLNSRLHALADAEQIGWVGIATKLRPAFYHDRSLFSSDNFHPSAAGYDSWSQVINSSLDEALHSLLTHCD